MKISANQIPESVLSRRTFAIISHPDAGKTTLTEQILLETGAINLAGQVRAKASSKKTISDFIKIEKERGISVSFIQKDLVFSSGKTKSMPESG